MSSEADKLSAALLNDPVARERLVKALALDLQSLEQQQSWWHRARPFLAGVSSALVVFLAFLIPSLQDQWNAYKIRTAVDRYSEIGRDLMRDGHFESAEQSFTRALELAGDQRLDLLEAQTRARVMRVYDDPNWHGKISDDLHESDFVYLLEIEDAAHQPTERAATLTAYATFLAGQNRLGEAEQDLGEAIKLDPKAVAPHIHLGNLLDDLGRTDAAEAEYRRAIALDPREPNAHYDLGLLLAGSQRPKEAEPEFRTYTELQPLDSDGPLQLAETLLAQNRTNDAAAAAETALKLNPRSEPAQNLLREIHTSRLPEQLPAQGKKAGRPSAPPIR